MADDSLSDTGTSLFPPFYFVGRVSQLALNSWSSCLYLRRTEITVVCHRVPGLPYILTAYSEPVSMLNVILEVSWSL